MDSPQYSMDNIGDKAVCFKVLNLIINGQSSILGHASTAQIISESFKPYYKWIVLNTVDRLNSLEFELEF